MAFPVLWGSAVTASKIGILLLYLTIFRNNRLFKIAAYSLIAIAFCYGLSVIVAGLTVCQPIAKYWDQTIDGTCGNVILFYVITSGFNLGIDLIILFLPLPMLWRLQVGLPLPTLCLNSVLISLDESVEEDRVNSTVRNWFRV